jgi:hypothetical protein
MEQQGKSGKVLFSAALRDRLVSPVTQTIMTSTFPRVSVEWAFRRVVIRTDRFREAHVVHSFGVVDIT